MNASATVEKRRFQRRVKRLMSTGLAAVQAIRDELTLAWS